MGVTLAQRLLSSEALENHYVVVIDREKTVCEVIYNQIGAIAICGSATSIQTLLEAGIKKADVAVALMRNDSENLAFCLLARSFGVPRVLVRMREVEFKEAYELAGATFVMPTVDLLINRFLTNIEQPRVRGLIDIGHELEVVAIDIPPSSPIAGMTVEEIAGRETSFCDCNFVACYDEAGNLEIPRGPTVIQGGSEVVLIANKNNIPRIVRFFTEGS
ncbi:MAG TPA: potassium transporter TrkA [Cyanobacteria bacterium UBA8530]|nr:potassium transporter TrkA [Cyanobacteria bacterium UBA8530]